MQVLVAHQRHTDATDVRQTFRPCVHFVGFRGEEYWSAVKVWGVPDFYHLGWDRRTRREIADGDIVIFARGPADQPVTERNFNDMVER